MTKKEFLKRLRKELDTLPRSEREKTIAYYDELIEDRKESGSTEEAAVCAMGEVKSIAAEILADAKERGVELKKRGMPTFLKVLIIVIAALFGVTVLASGVELVREYNLLGKAPEWEKVEKDIELGSISSINMDMTTVDLVITKSENDMIRLVYYTNDDLVKYTLDTTSDSVTLTQRSKWIMFGFLSMRNRKGAALYVPAGFTGTINAKTTTGDMMLENVSSAIALNISATTGDITIHGAKSDYALLSVKTGDMRITDCEFKGDMTTTGTTGSVAIKNVDTVQMNVKRTTGGIIIENVNAAKLEASVSTGGITANYVTADEVKLHATTGDVKLDRLDAKDIDISVSTGDVSGTIAGAEEDYTYETHTSTGRNNLPESFGHGERKLKIKASTGDIKIEFAN